MLLEIIRFAVYTICLTISLLLFSYLYEPIANGEEVSDVERFFTISPLLIMVLIGAFIENFKQIIIYPLIWGFLIPSIGFIESFFVTPELPPEPDFIDMAYISPFPYLLVYSGFIFLFLFSLLAIGFILGFIKRKIFT